METLHDRPAGEGGNGGSMFEHGLLELEGKGKTEADVLADHTSDVEMSPALKRYVPDEVKELETALGDQYRCNFSVFHRCWTIGRWDNFSDHADPPPGSTRTERDTCGHHLRLRWKGKQVYRFAGCEGDAAPASDPTRRAVLSGIFSHGRVSGHHGGSPQPFRPGERGARVPG